MASVASATATNQYTPERSGGILERPFEVKTRLHGSGKRRFAQIQIVAGIRIVERNNRCDHDPAAALRP
jgi:hypothetical protein